MKVDFLMSCPMTVEWAVYTVAYRKVYEERIEVNGARTVDWALKDGKGTSMASGMYFLEVKTGSQTVIRKVLVQ